MRGLRNHTFIQLVIIGLLALMPMFLQASPQRTTYQAKIIKPDGYPLEATSVNFKFTVLDPTASCILFSETYSSVNMSSTGGLISFSLGSGIKTYPASATTFADVFSNITPVFSCDAGGPPNYSPTAHDVRKMVMQFHDGNGWQTLPAMNINAVPYAMYANEAQSLNGLSVTDFVQTSTIPTCSAGQALFYTGASFTCVAISSGGVTSATITAALGYTPADGASFTALTSNFSSVSSTVFSVSSTVSNLSSTVSNLATAVSSTISSQWVTSGTSIYYNSGNVGIGTSSPAYAMQVDGQIGARGIALDAGDFNFFRGDGYAQPGADMVRIRRSSVAATLAVVNRSSATYPAISVNGTDFSASPTINLYANGSAYFSGNVGIGTITPSAKLHVSDILNAATTVRVHNASSGSAALATFSLSSDASSGGSVEMYASGYSGNWGSSSISRANTFAVRSNFTSSPSSMWVGTSSATPLYLMTDQNPRMVVAGDGNVGIGTISPAAKLEVTASSGPTAYFHSGVGNHFQINADGNSYGGNAAALQLSGDPVPGTAWKFVRGIADANGAPSERFYIDGTGGAYLAGNVGIGITTPITKLDVSGGVRIGMESATCAASFAGTLRYNSGVVEYCNGTSWGSFSGGSVTSASVISALGYTPATGVSVTTLQSDVASLSSAVAGLSSPWTVSGSSVHYAGGDAIINTVRVGLGAGNVSTNTALGNGTLNSNTSGGVQNTAVGYNALTANINGSSNIAVGYSAMANNSSGNGNVGIGSSALVSNSTGYVNVGIGSGALLSNLSGWQNIAIGGNSFLNNTTGALNVVIGQGAAGYQADGSTALQTANSSIYIGANAKGFNNSDFNSIVIGSNAIGPVKTLTVSGSAAFGSAPNAATRGTDYISIVTSSSGHRRTGIQFQKNAVQTFELGTDVNSNDGQNFYIYDNVTSAARFLIDGAGNVGIGIATPTTKLQVAGIIAPDADGTRDLGTSSLKFKDIYASNNVIQTSDARMKREIQETDLGLDFINKLRPVSYFWKDGLDKKLHYGLIAQETEKVISEAKQANGRTDEVDNVIVTHDHETDRYGVRYSELISPLIKAVQELYNKLVGLDRDIASIKDQKADNVAVEALKIENAVKDQEIKNLKQENEAIKARLEKIERFFTTPP